MLNSEGEHNARIAFYTVAVIVTYEPQEEAVFELLQALTPQVDKIIMVDNGSIESSPLLWNIPKRHPVVDLVLLKSNEGIAAAQNRGIEICLTLGASHIVFFDQDSVPEASMVKTLLQGLAICHDQDGQLPVAAISPATVDMRTGHISTFICAERTSGRETMKSNHTNALPMVEAAFLISSGMLVPVEVFENVRGLRSEFFIDHVDTEWCFRARAKGYRLVGVAIPLLRHNLGDKVKKVWFIRERHVSLHSPLRDYYVARNTLAMIRGGCLSFGWSIHFLCRILQLFLFYSIFSKNKFEHIKMIFIGLIHGSLKISGKYALQSTMHTTLYRSSIDPNH